MKHLLALTLLILGTFSLAPKAEAKLFNFVPALCSDGTPEVSTGNITVEQACLGEILLRGKHLQLKMSDGTTRLYRIQVSDGSQNKNGLYEATFTGRNVENASDEISGSQSQSKDFSTNKIDLETADLHFTSGMRFLF